jgi:hypothetical protein
VLKQYIIFYKINVLQENAPEELLAQKQEHGVEIVQKVLDMRGLQVRVLTNLENLNVEMKAIEDQITMLELQHNVKLKAIKDQTPMPLVLYPLPLHSSLL